MAPDALVVGEAVAEYVQARKRALDGRALAVGGVRESAGEIRPEARELLRDEKPPEAEAQLADRLPVACPLALLPHAFTCGCDVDPRSAGQLSGRIIQPGVGPAQPQVARGQPPIERVAQRDLQVADRLPERRR